MNGHTAAESAVVTLPDRVTVLTCIGCGAMGREERCEGARAALRDGGSDEADTDWAYRPR